MNPFNDVEMADNNPSRSPPGSGGGGGGSGGSGGASKHTYAKRGKITIVACVPCRRRKTKCDGRRPICSQCAARDGSCAYDMTDEQRKLTYLRDNVEQLQEKSNTLESLLQTVQSSSEEEAVEIFRRLRSGTDVRVVADQVQAGRVLSGVRKQSGAVLSPSSDKSQESGSTWERDKISQYETLLSTIAGSGPHTRNEIIKRIQDRQEVPTILQAAEVAQNYMDRSTEPMTGLEGAWAREPFGVMNGADMGHTHASLGEHSPFIVSETKSPWTTVTNNQDLINHLLALYFTWQHAFFQSFPEKLFRADFEAGRTKYCSSMLVNAICAAGCFLSDRVETRYAFQDDSSLICRFFNEALRLLHEREHSSITTTATLYLVSYVEGTRGNLSSLWTFSGRSVLMAFDIGLHRDVHTSDPQATDEEKAEFYAEEKARVHAFWGCFHVDQLTCFTLGRIPCINLRGVTIPTPEIEPSEDEEPWQPYGCEAPHRPGARASTFHQTTLLSRIINGTLMMFFAPTSKLSGDALLGEYRQYLEWKQKLPPIVASLENAPPHVLNLHMYYHACLLLLFRPFLKATFTRQIDVTPREVCRQAANNISDLWNRHRAMYGLAGIYAFQVHCLFTACTIHIINLPTISATNNLVQACNVFQQLVPRNDWARSCLTILRSLVEKWNLILPQDAEEALYREFDDGGSKSDSASEQGQHSAPSGIGTPQAGMQRQESFHRTLSQATQSSSSQRHDDPYSASSGSSVGNVPWASKRNSGSAADSAASTLKRARFLPNQIQQASGTVTAPEDLGVPAPNATSYLYAPQPGQPAPMLVPVDVSGSGGVSRTQRLAHEGSADEINGLQDGVEGLTFGDDWRDPFMGYLGPQR